MRNTVIPSLLSAALLSVGWLEISGLPLLVAFIPLLFICSRRSVGFWSCALWVGVTITLWTLLTVRWVWYAAPIGVIAAIVINVAALGGVLMLYRWASRRLPRVIAYTILVTGWVGFEWVYTIGQISFPWLVLGNGFANDVWAVQWYGITGVFGGSLWVLIANILLWEALRRRNRRYGIASAVWIVVPVAVSLAMFYSYKAPQQSVKVSVIQPNINPYTEKFSLSQEQQAANLVELIHASPHDVDFVVMPETAIDDRIWENQMQMSPSLGELGTLQQTEFPGAQFIIGANTYKSYRPGGWVSRTARPLPHSDISYDAYNSALAIDSTDRVQIRHKSKLVAGVEMMPFYSITKNLEFLIIDLGGITGQLGVDSMHRVFTSPRRVVAAAPICYESVYGRDFSQFVLRGAQIMFVITNDGWWENTPGHRQHFSFSRLRAIETRRAIARSANTGISGFIDPRGMVLQRLGWQQRGSLTAELPVDDKVTFYSRYGDYIGRLSFYIFLLCMLYVPSRFIQYK